MRGLPILIVGIVFFGYAISRPPEQSASKPVAFAPIPYAPKLADPPRGTSRPEAANVARASGPVDITPRVETPSATKSTAVPEPSVTKPSKTEVVLTAAAVAALIVAASRNAYYATGRPCACPDDRMRNGASCSSRSAYSRPGGASPLCYPSDVTAEMIKSYRSRVATR
jgi:hypothetical protein